MLVTTSEQYITRKIKVNSISRLFSYGKMLTIHTKTLNDVAYKRCLYVVLNVHLSSKCRLQMSSRHILQGSATACTFFYNQLQKRKIQESWIYKTPEYNI